MSTPTGPRSDRRITPPVAVAIALPLLLALVVAGLGVATRFGLGAEPAPVADTTPLAVAPVEAPAATGPDCLVVLAALQGDLPGGDSTLPVREQAEPRQPGVQAWAAVSRPVVLRCGLPRPAELVPTSPLIEVDGVSWLTLDDGVPNPTVITYVAVDRPVFVAVTTPTGLGNGPLQTISGVLGDTLPETPVPVR